MVSEAEVMEEGAMDCSSSPVDSESVEASEVKLAVSGYDVCCVFPTVVSVEIGVWRNSDVMTCVLLALEKPEMVSMEFSDLDISDIMEDLLLTVETDEVTVLP